ncbi:MAG: ABC transporter permease, partial [Verrucomicrobiales bacterium]|nr:ABC transporter permease [Verrucomicrobiales bacterium]
LGPAWVFLIASEAIAANAGLGYRIFVVQRQLGMNIILLYVALIMVIGLIIDGLMRWFIKSRYRWSEVS